MEHTFTLITPRLRLYAPSLTEVAALRRGEYAVLVAHINVTIPAEWWRGPTLLRLLPHLLEAMQHEPGDARWVWLVIEPRAAEVIGDIGFHGPLHDGATVEIGYSVVPSAQRHGYTTEATAALIRWAFAHTKIAQIIAQIEPTNAASLRVAAKLGMQSLPPLSAGHLCFGVARTQVQTTETRLLVDSDFLSVRFQSAFDSS